jgi:hypothetical protein
MDTLSDVLRRSSLALAVGRGYPGRGDPVACACDGAQRGHHCLGDVWEYPLKDATREAPSPSLAGARRSEPPGSALTLQRSRGVEVHDALRFLRQYVFQQSRMHSLEIRPWSSTETGHAPLVASQPAGEARSRAIASSVSKASTARS